jgi:hypothetical protein
MARLLQLQHPANGRYVALAVNDELFLLQGVESVYALAQKALREKKPLALLATSAAKERGIPYDPIYNGESDWRILPPLDHPTEPARCLVSGTGLTHRQSAANRDKMHAAGHVTDSRKIYQWGEAEGRPAPGAIGIQPEWFYKGTGTILKAHNEPLDIHAFCDDGGEEPEIAGLYIVDDDGVPRRLGYAVGNEFSDHKMEKKNYLYLAPSKLRQCSIGPELLVGATFDDIPGEVRVERKGEKVWSAGLKTGEAHMVHSLANMEHHQFKYPQHRRPGDVHVHYFGTSAFSFGAGIELQDGDQMIVEFQNFGRALKNPLRIEKEPLRLATVKAL